MKKQLKELREGKRTLKNNVLNWLNDQDDMIGSLEDLQHGGCQSGMINHLIYYTDTVRFYNTHRIEIERLLIELEENTGLSRTELFKGKLEHDDWFDTDETQKKNLLAWFGFEETAFLIGAELEFI